MNDSSNGEGTEEMTDSTTTGSPHAFNDKWDLASKHDIQITKTGMQASQVVLDALRLKRGSETAKWLNSLGSTIAANAVAATISQNRLQALPSALGQTSIPEWSIAEDTMIDAAIRALDKLFDEFEIYALEFNRTAQGTDLLVNSTRPIKNLDSNAKCISYAGHLSTRLWAMVIRGSISKVEVFIVPAELLLAFSIHTMEETGYKPLFVVEAEWQAEKPIWRIDNTIVTIEHIPMLAKELFGDLIRVASGQMNDTQLFADSNQSDVHNNTATVPQTQPPSTAPSATLTASEQFLSVLSTDINQLLEAGKVSLESDDPNAFEKIKLLTAKMETLKVTLTTMLDDIAKYR